MGVSSNAHAQHTGSDDAGLVRDTGLPAHHVTELVWLVILKDHVAREGSVHVTVHVGRSVVQHEPHLVAFV